MARHISVRDEYAPTFGRQNLTMWSGGFASDFEGWARELPKGGGFMVTLLYGDDKYRLECESPRTDENFERVDDAIAKAAQALIERRERN